MKTKFFARGSRALYNTGTFILVVGILSCFILIMIGIASIGTNGIELIAYGIGELVLSIFISASTTVLANINDNLQALKNMKSIEFRDKE